VKQNPEEEKPSGINVKQTMIMGALMALTGTVVGAVSMELYRYFRPKIPIPIPQPTPQPALTQNPVYPWMQPISQPTGFPMMQPQYTIQQIGGYPTQQPALAAQNPFMQPLLQLPPAQTVMPMLPPQAQDPEPLSRAELARWQRGLESWQRDLERRDAPDRRDHHDPRDPRDH
jgi:hypothetical protein